MPQGSKATARLVDISPALSKIVARDFVNTFDAWPAIIGAVKGVSWVVADPYEPIGAVMIPARVPMGDPVTMALGTTAERYLNARDMYVRSRWPWMHWRTRFGTSAASMARFTGETAILLGSLIEQWEQSRGRLDFTVPEVPTITGRVRKKPPTRFRHLDIHEQ